MMSDQKNYFCIHGIHAKEVCRDCESDLREGWIAERKVYSKQALYKKRRRYSGRCKNCGKPRGASPYKSECIDCRRRWREHIQAVKGIRPWEPGKRGRPPTDTKAVNISGQRKRRVVERKET
jgi:hypothetical protein